MLCILIGFWLLAPENKQYVTLFVLTLFFECSGCEYSISFDWHWQFISDNYWRTLPDWWADTCNVTRFIRRCFGDIEPKSDYHNYQYCVSLWWRECCRWAVLSFSQSWSSTGRQWQQVSAWNIWQKRVYCWNFWLKSTIQLLQIMHTRRQNI